MPPFADLMCQRSCVKAWSLGVWFSHWCYPFSSLLELLNFFSYLESCSVLKSSSVYLWTPFKAHSWKVWYGCQLSFLTPQYKKICSWSKINQTLSPFFYLHWKNTKTEMTREPKEISRGDSISFCFWSSWSTSDFWSPTICFSLISSVLWSSRLCPRIMSQVTGYILINFRGNQLKPKQSDTHILHI